MTCAISEYDAALMVGLEPEAIGLQAVGRTAVSKGWDFVCDGIKYQVKANRPSGKKGSFVTRVGLASNYDWDRLVWVLYDREFVVQEAWIWTVEEYFAAFDGVKRGNPDQMRRGKRLA